MNASSNLVKAGLAAPVIILLVTLVTGASLSGFLIFKKITDQKTPAESSPRETLPTIPPFQPDKTAPPSLELPKADVKPAGRPFMGIWKVEKHYIFERTSKQWIENQAVIDESQRYLRFTKEGTICKGAPTSQGFICADKEAAFDVSADLILISGIAEEYRIRWSMSEGKLELIYELPVQDQLEQVIKYILLPQ